VTDIVEIGPPVPDSDQPISYAIGPSQFQRFRKGVMIAPALGVAALAISLASLMVVNGASEIGDVHTVTTGGQSPLLEFRWAAGLRMGLSAVALALAIAGIVMLLGRRPRLTVESADIEADDEALDVMEAAALASSPMPAAWMSTLLGSSLLVSVIALALNAASFGYAMAAHLPAPTSAGVGF
jgi:hypothetical protein